MWPWSHLALGYLLFSFGFRARYEGRPSDSAVFALALGTQFPDLVDKPAAWWLGVLPSGISLAHSILVAVPLSVAALLVFRHLGRPQVGFGFAIGYLSHLVGDVLWPIAVGGELPTLLWPLVPVQPDDGPFLWSVYSLLDRYVAFLGTPRGTVYLGLSVALLVASLELWRRDRYPGLHTLRRHLASKR